MNDEFITRNSILISGVLLNLPGKLLKNTEHGLVIKNYFNKKKLWIFTTIIAETVQHGSEHCRLF